MWGATTFDRYATPQIPAQLSGYRNSVKVDVPSRFDGPGGQLNSEPYFTTCSVSATYGHWDYPPSFADYSAQPDEYWPQEITVVLPLAKSAEVPDRLTLVLAGTAAIPNGLGAEPSITWNRFSDGLEVDGGTAADTVTWGQPYPDDYITFVVPGPGTRFTLRFADGELVVGHEDVQLRILFRSKVKSPVGVEQGVRTTVNLPLMWGVSWESPLWGNPACGTATATARLKGSLTNSARYRLDSGANVDDTGYEVARTVVSPKEPFYGTTIYSTSAPQLSFIDRNAEAAAQRKATIATSFWVAAGLGVIPLGLQVFPWGAVRRSTAERPARSG